MSRDDPYNVGNITTSSEEARFRNMLWDFPSLTRPATASRKCLHNPQHHIRTTRGQPVAFRPQHLHPEKLLAAQAVFDRLLKAGIVTRSDSPWASPIHMVRKKGNSWRVCRDYRALNAHTIPDLYPIHSVTDFNSNISSARIFSVVNYAKVFSQTPMAPHDIKKTAVITPFGLFEYNFIPFGFRNTAQTWQQFMHEVLRELPRD